MEFALYEALDYTIKGLLGEHIVDHHVIEQKGWGLTWNCHDMVGIGTDKKPAGWQGRPKKLNDNEIPFFLCTPSARVRANGIDSAWLTNRPQPHEFAIVEAKANMNPKASLPQLLGEAKGQSTVPVAQGGSGRRGGQRNTGRPGTGTQTNATPPAGPKPGMVMQMSHTWIQDRIKSQLKEYVPRMLGGIAKNGNYSRHVFLISPLQAVEHIRAIEKIMEEGLINKPAEAQKYAGEHATHNVQREFGEADLDAAEEKYKAEGKPKKPSKPRRNNGNNSKGQT